ncbi:HNH endonuclease, partial [Mycolicibacterium phlei]
GRGGWTERQHPDGTLELRAPTGHLYVHQPHGAAMFPALAQATGDLNIQAAPEPEVRDRIALMPPRKRSYDDEKRKRISAERRQRAELIAQQHQHQARLATNDKPPPF